MSLFQCGQFRLHSGGVSDFKIECDALTSQDWCAIAQQVAKIHPIASEIIGIPTGGELFAENLRLYVDIVPTGPRIVVDDVLTTGASFKPYK